MGVREARLAADHARLLALAEGSGGRIALVSAVGNPPTEYVVEVHCRSVVRLQRGQPEFGTRHRVRIILPPSYPGPTMPPHAELLTPIFHPHVFTNGVVCLGSRHRVSEFLDLLVMRIGEILRLGPDYLDPASPANSVAMEWAVANRASLPLDPASFLGAEAPPPPKMTWCDLR